MIRYVLSIIGGFVAWTILFLGGNALLAALNPSAFNEDGSTDSLFLLLLTLTLTVCYSIVAGAITARIAKEKRSQCGLVLGLLLLAVGLMVQLQFWNVVPLWYNLAFLAFLVPATWVGAKLTG